MSKLKRQSLREPSKAAEKPRHCFGSHLSVAGGIHHAAEEALTLRFETVQVFVKNQRQWSAPPLNPEHVARWKELINRPEFGPTVAHATYLLNLASPDKELYEKSRQAFADELLRCDALDIPYLVVHPGAALQQTVTKACRRIAAALNWIFKKNPQLRTMPLLETTAGQGTTIGRSFAELAAIIEDVEQAERIGICIDTCHVFAAGYDISDSDKYAEMVREIEQTVGVPRVRCWHFNDSLGECGQHLDRHAHIGHGQIGVAGFRNVLADERFRGIPMILETPKGEDDRGRSWDKQNVTRLRRIAAQIARHE